MSCKCCVSTTASRAPSARRESTRPASAPMKPACTSTASASRSSCSIRLRLAQHARQRQQRVSRGRWTAGNAPVQVGCDLQHLLQRQRVEFEAGFGGALDRQVRCHVAALQRLAGEFPPAGLAAIPAVRQPEAQFQRAAVDAAQLPRPGDAVDRALGAGESSHGGNTARHGSGHTSGLVSCEAIARRLVPKSGRRCACRSRLDE